MPHSKLKTPVTWSAIENLLDNSAGAILRNRDIAAALDADMTDVSALTRIMTKAGAIRRRVPDMVRDGPGLPMFYSAVKK